MPPAERVMLETQKHRNAKYTTAGTATPNFQEPEIKKAIDPGRTKRPTACTGKATKQTIQKSAKPRAKIRGLMRTGVSEFSIKVGDLPYWIQSRRGAVPRKSMLASVIVIPVIVALLRMVSMKATVVADGGRDLIDLRASVHR
jgi:hypothetical protein